MNFREAGVRPAFPPGVVVAIKALACEMPSRRGLPLARWSVPELRQEAIASGIVAAISGATPWRWPSQDAPRPWRHRTWTFPRDPRFARKAGVVPDLCQRRWRGKPPGPRDYVLSTDERTSIQARRRKHHPLPPAPGRSIRVEHEYTRGGALAYLAALDVHRARLSGRCERRTGIAPFERLVARVMAAEPCHSAHRVYFIADNGSSHRGTRAAVRLKARWPNVVLVHTPIHASWLNQIEIHFSIVLEDNVNLYHVVRGSRSEIQGASVKVPPHVWHTLGLKAEGERFTVSFNGAVLFTVADRTFAGPGKVALWTKADSVTRFHGLSVVVV